MREAEFSYSAVGRVAVAQICESIGYDGAQRPALEALTDIATRYLKSVAKLSAESANSSGRTQSNLFDVIAALQDLASIQGFQGSWRVRSPCLLKSSVIKDLMKLVKYKNQVQLVGDLRRMRSSCWEREGVGVRVRDESMWYNEGSLKHVPRWLPPVEVEQRKNNKEEEVNLGPECDRFKRECNQELRVKREKVRFKMGNCKRGGRRHLPRKESSFFLVNAVFELQHKL